MATPIVGPFTTYKNVSINAVGSRYRKQVRYKQQKPYNLPLPYTTEARAMLAFVTVGRDITPGPPYTWLNVANGRSPWQFAGAMYDSSDPTMQSVLNVARERFVEKARGEQAALLTALAESKKTMSLLDERIRQCYYFFKAVRRRDFYGAADAVGAIPRVKARLKADPTWKQRWTAKRFADRSLEFAFGWAPLYNDIITAADVLSRPLPYASVKASKTYRYRWVYGPTYSNQSCGWMTYTAWHNVRLRCVVGAEVWADNPNLNLAANLGLTDYLGTVWEVVPWSFVVDYWFNVSQFLGQFSELGGLGLRNPYHTILSEDFCTYRAEWRPYGHVNLDSPGPCQGAYPGAMVHTEWALRAERKLDIPAVTLNWKLPWELSKFRAWTSVSLLLQVLGKGH